MRFDFHLTFNITPSDVKFGYGDHIGFLGSCFSDEMFRKARYYGFNCSSNPFGTVFHPLALSRFVNETLSDTSTDRIVQRNDLYFSEDAGSKLFNFTREDLTDEMNQVRDAWKHHLASAKFLFITFGTAWGYRSRSTGSIVANCHKLPGDHFTKELSGVNEIVSDWMDAILQLKQWNPALNIVFTVSPVRHVRDGLIQNNRSKAILIEAVRQLNDRTGTGYFPSYEIVMDELRDHRFFKEDRVHPNDEAVNYVWEKFVNTYCVESTIQIMKEVKRYRLSAQHRTLFEDSEEDMRHRESVSRIREDLMKRYPEVVL